MRYSITSNFKNFLNVLGKMECSTHWKFGTYGKMFGLWKTPEYLYPIFDALFSQATFEMRTLQVLQTLQFSQ